MITLPPQMAKIAEFLLKGLSNKEIANQSGVSEYSVKQHINRLMERCRCANRTALALKLEREGFVVADQHKNNSKDGSGAK